MAQCVEDTLWLATGWKSVKFEQTGVKQVSTGS